MRSFYSLLTYRKPCLKCGRVKNCMLQLVCRPAASYPACACLSNVCPRQQQGERGGREKGKEGRRKREGEGKGEKGERRKEERRRGKGEEGSGIQAHLGCLLVGGVTTGSSLSAIWSATLYPPTRCLRMSHRVRLAALVGSFTAISKSRCVR